MKHYIGILLVLFTILSFPGCTITVYEDTNGEADFSLQTLTEEDIVRGTNTVQVMTSTATVNDKTVCKAKTISGVVELWNKTLKDEALEIVVSCEISKGNARLVLVIDDEIVHNFALNAESQHFSLDNVTGKISLKLAGESAGYRITYTVS